MPGVYVPICLTTTSHAAGHQSLSLINAKGVVVVAQNNEGPWDASCWALAEEIRTSNDIEFVLSHIDHPDSPVRLKVADWFDFGDAHWRARNVDASSVMLPSHAPMPNDVCELLIRDASTTVAASAALRANDVSLLIDVVLDPATTSHVCTYAMRRLLDLGGLDEFLATCSDERPVPVRAMQVVASTTPRIDILDSLLAIPSAHEALLSNPALTKQQLETLIGVVHPGRPAGDRDSWAQDLREANLMFVEAGTWASPGGFEAAELRDVGPAAGRLLASAAPLLSAAADALPNEQDAPPWVEQAITWALEISRYHTNARSMYARLGISPNRLTIDAIPRIPSGELRDAGDVLRRLAETSDQFSALAEGAASLFEALCKGEGSAWALRYGGGNGYDDLHMSEILMLTSSDELRATVLGR